MTIDPGDFASKLVLGLFHEKHLQEWIRLGVSVAITSYVTFLGVFGMTVLSGAGFVKSLGTACLVTSITVVFLWRKSPAAAAIPLVIPGRIQTALQDAEVKDGMVTSNTPK